jgi:transposase-like protein/IS1 family transposase
VKTPRCPDTACARTASVIRHGFYKTKSGKRRRYRCRSCGQTFCSTKGTPYYRLQHRRSTFDQVASLSVEGVSKSAIDRVKGIACNTVDRWLEKAAECCRRFNDSTITELEIPEIQADEIRTFSGGKGDVVWVFATLDVASRLWPSTVVGRRSYRNTYALFKDTLRRMRDVDFPFIVTDGFEFYEKVIRRLFGIACVYGQVLKLRRNDRVIRVYRRQIVGANWRFDEALVESEDSTTLNTSFVERLNLTIRQGSAYLCRRALSHARSTARLDDHLELLRCHYNFLRPHRALKFGSKMRTPAMQAGLTSRRLSFREIFSSTGVLLALENVGIVFADSAIAIDTTPTRRRLAA